jgi:hypothetical protein
VLIDIDDLEDNVMDLSQNVMNGRQIRNVVTTGLASSVVSVMQSID